MSEKSPQKPDDKSALEVPDEKQIEKKNTVTLVVLVAVIVILMFSSYFLFNNYWDPNVSDTTFSH